MPNMPYYAKYLCIGFKAIRLRGFNRKFNPKSDYKTAKTPIDKNFTAPDFKGLGIEEIDAWEETEGWVGWLVPEGFIVLDSERPAVHALLEGTLQPKDSSPSIQRTNRGKQYLLIYTGSDIPATSEYFCVAGFPITPRVAGKNYVIMPPTNGRQWESWTHPEVLLTLPAELKPHDRANPLHIARCLSWAVGEAYREGKLTGYDDLDCAFIAFLADTGLELCEIQRCFKMIFLSEYDEMKTEQMFRRHCMRKDSGETVIGAGSFVKRIHDEGLEDVSSWIKKLKRLAGQMPSENIIKDSDSIYFEDEHGYLCKNKYIDTKNISLKTKVRLANFTAEITDEISEDDGQEVTRKYVLEGRCSNTNLGKIIIPAAQFASMTWIHQWGSRVIIEPGATIKDTVRHAIQVRSRETRHCDVYTHTGWRKINGNWIFLSHGSAIGGHNVDVQLVRETARYSLPPVPENEEDAIRTSLSILDIGKHDVTLPLFTAAYIAPLTSLFYEFNPINFSFYAYGQTGTFKTTLAVLALSHFGTFTASALPNLEDTANSVERRAFLLKDVLMILDDYHPSGLRREAQAKDILVQRVIREFSNRTGRGRLNSDAREKGRHAPRGMLLITGEEITNLQSTIARIFVIEINRGDVDIQKLSQTQSLAHHLPHAMTSYIRWIQCNMERLKHELPLRFIRLRQSAAEGAGHQKLPEQVAFLTLTLELVASWLKDKGIFTDEDANALVSEGWDIFKRLTDRHGQRILEEDPILKFEEIIITLQRMGVVAFGHLQER